MRLARARAGAVLLPNVLACRRTHWPNLNLQSATMTNVWGNRAL
jgi:hypothetical protein